MKLQRPVNHNYQTRGWINGSHRGIDYGWLNANPEGSKQVYAAASGRVVTAYKGNGYNQGWGNRIIIDHGHGNFTAYNHLRPGGVEVNVGQWVNAGQRIGMQGATGEARGVHLHFELMLGGSGSGNRVDPAPYFSRDLPGTGSTPPETAPTGGSGGKVDLGGESWFWYRSAADAEAHRNKQGAGGRMLTGPYPVLERSGGGAIKVQSKQNGIVWLSPQAASKVSGSAPAPAPTAKQRYVDLKENWYYYNSEADARAARNLQRWAPPGRHRIDGGSGPYNIYVGALGRNVWVGSSRTNPPVVWL